MTRVLLTKIPWLRASSVLPNFPIICPCWDHTGTWNPALCSSCSYTGRRTRISPPLVWPRATTRQGSREQGPNDETHLLKGRRLLRKSIILQRSADVVLEVVRRELAGVPPQRPSLGVKQELLVVQSDPAVAVGRRKSTRKCVEERVSGGSQEVDLVEDDCLGVPAEAEVLLGLGPNSLVVVGLEVALRLSGPIRSSEGYPPARWGRQARLAPRLRTCRRSL